jgi:hypothetical protein
LNYFIAQVPTKQFRPKRNHFSLAAQNCGNRSWLSSDQQMTAHSVGKDTFGDSQMRTVSFVLALTFLVAGSSMAGSVESSLPGVGTFTYNGSPIVTPAPLVVAVN